MRVSIETAAIWRRKTIAWRRGCQKNAAVSFEQRAGDDEGVSAGSRWTHNSAIDVATVEGAEQPPALGFDHRGGCGTEIFVPAL